MPIITLFNPQEAIKMRIWDVFVQNVELKRITKSDIFEFMKNEKELDKAFQHEMDSGVDPFDPSYGSFKYDSKEEAMAKFNEIKSSITSHYYPCNKLLEISRVCIDEFEVDDDGEVIEFFDMHYEWLWLDTPEELETKKEVAKITKEIANNLFTYLNSLDDEEQECFWFENPTLLSDYELSQLDIPELNTIVNNIKPTKQPKTKDKGIER